MRYVPLLALCGLAAALQAQSVGVNAGSSATATIAPGAKITVPIVIDLTSAGAVNIAALQSSFTWNALRLTFDSVRVASGLGWTFTPNTTNAASGSVSFSASSASQFPSTGTLANLFFTAGTAGGTRVIPAPSSAANAATQSILAALRVRSLDVCVADAVLYGDANNDATVNIIDAQQIARFTVSLSVLNQTALTDRGDVNADGTVNIIDAQQIARFSVGLSAAARTNTSFIVDPVPTSMVIAPSAAQTVAVGGSVQLNANPQQSSTDVSGCTAVTWQSSDQNVATVTSSGYVTGIAGGVATLTATSVSAPSVQATTSVTVAGSVVTATVSLGQTTLALATVAGGVTTGNPTTSASAVARDALNNVVAATPVWSSSNARVARVAADGTVQAIGSGSSTITATFGSVTANATLNVTAAASGFTVHVRMVTSVTPSVQTAFDNAATRWAQIIRGHLPDVSVNNLDVSACAGQSAGTTVLTEVLQDVVIYANIAPIDGVGSILGQAGPCFIRGGGGLPVIGMMKFDSDDLANMEANGILVPVILHEMGHVLGIGTMWGSLLEDAMPSASQDPIFTGANAIWAMNNLGTGYAGRPAPVENCVGRANCGSGTINSHWREGILARELMTGFVTSSGGLNPLSPLTAASLIDIGYVVDVAQSDPQPWFLRLGPVTEEPLIEIREGSPPVPRAVDAAGRILPSPVIRR